MEKFGSIGPIESVVPESKNTGDRHEPEPWGNLRSRTITGELPDLRELPNLESLTLPLAILISRKVRSNPLVAK